MEQARLVQLAFGANDRVLDKFGKGFALSHKWLPIKETST